MATATVVDMAVLPTVLTMQHVQEILGISRAKTYELAHRREFPVVRLGRTMRVPREAFLRWLNTQASRAEE